MDDVLTLQRDIFVPAELVFDVWTRPDHLAGWYPAPRERLEPGATPDSFELRAEDGAVLEAVVKVDAERPRALAWEVTGGGRTTRLDVGFAGGGGTCSMSLRHSGLASAAARDRQQELWQARLERLVAYFAVI